MWWLRFSHLIACRVGGLLKVLKLGILEGSEKGITTLYGSEMRSHLQEMKNTSRINLPLWGYYSILKRLAHQIVGLRSLTNHKMRYSVLIPQPYTLIIQWSDMVGVKAKKFIDNPLLKGSRFWDMMIRKTTIIFGNWVFNGMTNHHVFNLIYKKLSLR